MSLVWIQGTRFCHSDKQHYPSPRGGQPGSSKQGTIYAEQGLRTRLYVTHICTTPHTRIPPVFQFLFLLFFQIRANHAISIQHTSWLKSLPSSLCFICGQIDFEWILKRHQHSTLKNMLDSQKNMLDHLYHHAI